MWSTAAERTLQETELAAVERAELESIFDRLLAENGPALTRLAASYTSTAADGHRNEQFGRQHEAHVAGAARHFAAQIGGHFGIGLPLRAPAFQFRIGDHRFTSIDSRSICRARVKRAPTLLSEVPSTCAISP